jgi:iron complex transport system permease protein
MLFSKHLDVLLLGDEYAHSVGVSPWIRRGALVIASISTAIVAGFFGIISFVGLMGPHLARRFIGSSHSKLFWFSAILGADIMVIADLLSRGVIYPMEIPVGVFTSVAGGIFFLYLIFRWMGRWS